MRFRQEQRDGVAEGHRDRGAGLPLAPLVFRFRRPGFDSGQRDLAEVDPESADERVDYRGQERLVAVRAQPRDPGNPVHPLSPGNLPLLQQSSRQPTCLQVKQAKKTECYKNSDSKPSKHSEQR